MQKHLNYHKHEPRDLEDRLSHTVLLITNSSYVISYLIFNLFTAYIFLFFRIISSLFCIVQLLLQYQINDSILLVSFPQLSSISSSLLNSHRKAGALRNDAVGQYANSMC